MTNSEAEGSPLEVQWLTCGEVRRALGDAAVLYLAKDPPILLQTMGRDRLAGHVLGECSCLEMSGEPLVKVSLASSEDVPNRDVLSSRVQTSLSFGDLRIGATGLREEVSLPSPFASETACSVGLRILGSPLAGDLSGVVECGPGSKHGQMNLSYRKGLLDGAYPTVELDWPTYVAWYGDPGSLFGDFLMSGLTDLSHNVWLWSVVEGVLPFLRPMPEFSALLPWMCADVRQLEALASGR